MRRITTKLLLVLVALVVVLYPLYVRYAGFNFDPNASLASVFSPAFGLIAFTLLWIHAICGVFEPWLRKQFNFDRFVYVTSIIILICIILHPLLLFVQLGTGFIQIFFANNIYIWLGIIGLLLLLTYDIGKAFNKYDFFSRNWNKILIISTVGFLLIFFHSLNLGSDLQSDPLRSIWIFYGVTAIFATLYTYGYKKIKL